MKRIVLVLAFGMLVVQGWASVKLSGVIFKYKISMELVASSVDKDYCLRGKYNYAGKTQSLDLKGNLYSGDVLHLTESFEGKETGDFYLERNDGGDWSGSWIGNGKKLDCELSVTSGDMWDLRPYDLEALHEQTSESITGSYVDESYWINDAQDSEESPNLEVGFNGGVVTIQTLPGDKIRFSLTRVCGPYYHEAGAEGIATKIGPGKYYYEAQEYDDTPCKLTFIVKNRSVEVVQDGTDLACGFGASAYAEGSYMKVNDKAVTGSQVEDVIPKQ